MGGSGRQAGSAGGSRGVQAGTLVIQTAFLGDVVLTTPLLSALAERDGPVDVVTTPAAARLLERHPAVRAVIRYDKHGADAGWRGLRRLGRGAAAPALSRGSYLPAPLAPLGRHWRCWPARRSDRLCRQPGGAHLHPRVPRPREGHEVERLLALAGAPRRCRRRAVSLGLRADRSRRGRCLARGPRCRPGFVALAPGSIWGTKRWPYYAELAAGLDRPSVIVGRRGRCGAGRCRSWPRRRAGR